ncbi:MAG: Txe/YoeB family addiction module toxin [Candidatus Lactobacillus pullistercoris]|uniref:Endoribonuclease YoeB n=1 Tax=Candidatus Lactobacillus pullistercoris TaxID=2838636 RepID=A0A9E2KRH3_9LACO|nr:Txe/YoeB family addiction module toxin [Candidatus Lactobacillus pullistercoris]
MNKLISDTIRHPFTRLGDPKPLQHELIGYWSRRINRKDRMVYIVYTDRIESIQLKQHYY